MCIFVKRHSHMSSSGATNPGYGAIPSQNRPQKPVTRAKLSVMAKVAPFLVLFCMVSLTLVSSRLEKAERRYDQDLYAIEEDDIYNKRLMWTGEKWVDETTGKEVKLAERQTTQQLLLTQVLAQSKPSAVAKGGAAKNYDCCYLSGKEGGHQALVTRGKHSVDSGFYCHMPQQGVPNTKWPMIRMGSLREAGVSTADGQGEALVNGGTIHSCPGNLLFLKAAREVSLVEGSPANAFGGWRRIA